MMPPDVVLGRARVLSVLLWLSAGSALAQEKTESPPDAAEATAQPRPGREERFEWGMQAGYAWRKDSEGYGHQGLGARLHLLARLGRFFSVGPEVALYAHAGSQLHVIEKQGGGEDGFFRNAALFQLGAVARVGQSQGVVRPALLAGLAWYRGERSGLGFSAGVELAMHLDDSLPLVVDARLHFSSATGFSQTLGLATRLYW